MPWSKVRDRHYLRHVRPMSRPSGDRIIMWHSRAMIAFPLVGEDGSRLGECWGEERSIRLRMYLNANKFYWLQTQPCGASAGLWPAGPSCYLPPHEKNQWIILKLLSPFNLDLEFFSSSSATITPAPAASRVHPNKRTSPESPSCFDSMNQSSTQINATFPLSIKVNILSSRDNVLGSGS